MLHNWRRESNKFTPDLKVLILESGSERHNLRKGVATSSDRRHLHNILGRYEILDRFHMTLTAEDVTVIA